MGEEALRSANVLVDKVLADPDLRKQLTIDPEKTLKKTSRRSHTRGLQKEMDADPWRPSGIGESNMSKVLNIYILVEVVLYD